MAKQYCAKFDTFPRAKFHLRAADIATPFRQTNYATKISQRSLIKNRKAPNVSNAIPFAFQ
jgi:predicted transposase YdaD